METPTVQTFFSLTRTMNFSLKLTINGPATLLRATDTTLIVRMQRRFVINSDLFTRLYVAQCNEENVFVQNLHERIRFARVIDVVRAISAATSIDTPPVVYRADS